MEIQEINDIKSFVITYGNHLIIEQTINAQTQEKVFLIRTIDNKSGFTCNSTMTNDIEINGLKLLVY